MAKHMLLYVLGLSAAVMQVSAQTLSFPNPVIVDDQSRNWWTEGSVQLSDSDLVLFQPKVNIQTCSDLCTVDLQHCLSEDTPATRGACYCRNTSQKEYTLHIGSRSKWTDSGRLLTATIPSRDIFGSISASGVLGKLPQLPKEKLRAKVTYQLAKGPSYDLLPFQNVSICPNRYIHIQICVKDKEPGSILSLNLNSQELRTDRPCARFSEIFEFNSTTSHKLVFTYEASAIGYGSHVSHIYLHENTLHCDSSKKSTTKPKAIGTIHSHTHGLDSEFFDIFKTQNPEWRLIFRGSSGVNQSIFSAFSHNQKISVEPSCKTIFNNETCWNHYRNNNALDNWTNVHQVAFIVIKGSQMVANIVFDAADSDFQSWLSQDRVVSSSWLDLKTRTGNHFSISGDSGLMRRFFMNKHYGGCTNDNGWFVAVDRHRVPCTWENNHGFPAFLYSKTKRSTNWSKGNVGVADYIAILVNYNGYEEASEYFDIFATNKKEWRIAFRGTPGINESIWEAYSQTQKISVQPGCKKVYSRETCSYHYRNNDVLDNWSNVYQVAFVVFKDHKNVAEIVFDAVGSDCESWFSQKRIVNSSWYDLKTDSANFFSIRGDNRHVRRLLINKSYGGCPQDNGWFVAVDRKGVSCPWETNRGYPKFFYATKYVSTNWLSGDVGVADYVAIFVKYF